MNASDRRRLANVIRFATALQEIPQHVKTMAGTSDTWILSALLEDLEDLYEGKHPTQVENLTQSVISLLDAVRTPLIKAPVSAWEKDQA